MTRLPEEQLATKRRGSVSLWFAALLFVFLPLAALVIDLSLARLARRQMQTAVNTAALEGLRWRDEDWDHRRDRARKVGLSVFSQDLLLTDESAPSLVIANNLKYVDGNEIAGAASFQAGALIELDGTLIYNPQFQLNSDNDLDGDLVAGDYHPESFSVEEPAEEPGNAFLARLQRTGQSGMTGFRSDGDPVPFLFGRGGVTAALPPNDPAAIWNRRERGTIVRATAIAKAVPALRVGPIYPASMFPSLTQAIRGVAPFAFSVDSWNSNSFSGVPILIDGTGESADPEVRIIRTTSLQGLIDSSASSTTIVVQWNDGVIDATPFVIRIGTELLQVTASIGESWTVVRGYHGTTIASHDTGTPIHRQSSLVAGTPLSLIRSNRPTNLGGSTDYIPIFDHDTQRIVGFGYGNWTWDPGPNSLTVKKLTDTPYILPQNASASVGKAWAQLGLSESDISGLMSANAAVTGSIHVPALQRTIP